MENKDENNRDAWMQEINNETEHYFQGEMQHDQRASWILATTSGLITLLIGLQISAMGQSLKLPIIYLLIAVGSYFISAVISIFVMLPLRGVRSFWNDLFGNNYHRNAKKSVHDLIQEHFRQDNRWSQKSLEIRVKYHFRSHYLRNTKKAYGIIWASLFLLIGLIFSAINVIFINF